MLARVLQQLADDDGERRRHFGVQLAGVAFDAELDVPASDDRLLGHPHEVAHDLAERDLLTRIARQHFVHAGDRPDASLGFAQRDLAVVLRRQPPRLQPQQRRNRLQVVLHAVVDLADRRVLRKQQPVAPTNVGDVAQQYQAAGDLAAMQQRQAAQQDGDVGRRLDFFHHGATGEERTAHRGLLDADLVEARAGDVGVDAHAVQRVDRVRRRVFDAAGRVENHGAVADAGRVLADVVVAGERELAAHDHAGEAFERLAVHALERARATGRAERRLACHHRDHVAVVAHRDALHADAVGLLAEADLAFDDLARPKGSSDDGPIGLGERRGRRGRRGATSGLCSAASDRAR